MAADMTALTNPRQERFARLVASDMPVARAYSKAGFAADKGNAHKLAKRPIIAERVSELQAEALAQEGVSVGAVVSGVAAIAFHDPRSFFEWDADGVRVRPGVNLSAEDAKCIVQVEQIAHKGERTIRVRLADRLRALEILGRWGGLDKPAPEQHVHLHEAATESPLALLEERLGLLASRLGGARSPEALGSASE